MDTSQHSMHNLFEQLGLPSSEQDIEQFIRTHRLFSQDIQLDQATFWTPAQADFLHQMWAAQHIQPREPQNFITSAGLGTMGFGQQR